MSFFYCSRSLRTNTKLKLKSIYKRSVIHQQWETTKFNSSSNQQNKLSELTTINFTRCFLMPQFYMLQHIPPLFCLVWAIGTCEMGCLATVQWLFRSVQFFTTCFIDKYLAQMSTYGVSDWRVWWPIHPANIQGMFGFASYFLECFITQLQTFTCSILCCLINTRWLHSCKISMIQSPVIMLQSFIEFCPLNRVYLKIQFQVVTWDSYSNDH